MSKGVKYIWDILRDVAEKEGRSYEEVKELWLLHKKYVEKKMQEDDTYIIEVPHIGNLYFSRFLFNLFNGKSKKGYEYLREKVNKFDSMLEHDMNTPNNTKYTYPQKSRISLLRLYKSIKLHIDGVKKRYSSKEKIIKRIEKYSNNE